MKYVKRFKQIADYDAFKNGDEYITPNISYINEVKGIRMKPYIPPPVLVGDVAYWDGSKVKTTPYSKWNTSLGTPVGVVVIPEGFAPDGKIRIVSLLNVDKSGNTTTSTTTMKWGPTRTDTELTNFIRVPITDNNGSTSTGSHYNGYLPSDKFTGATSFVDPKAKYNSSASSGTLIPSPYLGDVPNPEYYKEILSGDTNVNVLSDFNGLSNTETLVGLGTAYEAANACWKYKDGASNLQWYLPAMGELGYIMPRFNEINNVIKALGGVVVFERGHFWCSSEKSDFYICSLYAPTGQYSYANYSKQSDLNARPFATIGEIKAVNLITFNIDGGFSPLHHDLTAEEGMTWIEWCNSKYNTVNATYYVYNEYVVVSVSNDVGSYTSNGLTINSVINNNESYYFAPERPD